MKQPTWYFTTILLVLFSLTLNAQTDIYVELFDEDGAGVRGACPAIDPSVCSNYILPTNGQWSITGDASGLDGGSDSLMVRKGSLAARDLDEELCFLTQSIDISNFENIKLNLNLREQGDLETSDYIDVTYIVDGTPILIQNFNGQGSATHTLIGVTGSESTNPDWGSAAIEQDIPEGTSLQVEVCFDNNPGTEFYFLDDVVVSGDMKTVDPIPTMSQWSLFILGLIMSSLGLVFIRSRSLIKVEV